MSKNFSALIESKLMSLTDSEKRFYINILQNIEKKYLQNKVFAKKFDQEISKLFTHRIGRNCMKKVLDRAILYDNNNNPIDLYKLLLGKPINISEKDYCMCLYYHPNIQIDDNQLEDINRKTEVIIKKLKTKFLEDFENQIYSAQTEQEIIYIIDYFFTIATQTQMKKPTHKIQSTKKFSSKHLPYYNPLFPSGYQSKKNLVFHDINLSKTPQQSTRITLNNQKKNDLYKKSKETEFTMYKPKLQEKSDTTDLKTPGSDKELTFHDPIIVNLPKTAHAIHSIPYYNPVNPYKKSQQTQFKAYEPKLQKKSHSTTFKSQIEMNKNNNYVYKPQYNQLSHETEIRNLSFKPAQSHDNNYIDFDVDSLFNPNM